LEEGQKRCEMLYHIAYLNYPNSSHNRNQALWATSATVWFNQEFLIPWLKEI
jgi:hypothetical protein